MYKVTTRNGIIVDIATFWGIITSWSVLSMAPTVRQLHPWLTRLWEICGSLVLFHTVTLRVLFPRDVTVRLPRAPFMCRPWNFKTQWSVSGPSIITPWLVILLCAVAVVSSAWLIKVLLFSVFFLMRPERQHYWPSRHSRVYENASRRQKTSRWQCPLN